LTLHAVPRCRSPFIFVLGIFWRLVGVWGLRYKKDLSEPRASGAWIGGIKGLFVHAWPYKPFVPKVGTQYIVGYLIHLGLFIVIFLFGTPHMLFFKDITRFRLVDPARGRDHVRGHRHRWRCSSR
jgi:hypothetical protein